jgi:hypothetical protein
MPALRVRVVSLIIFSLMMRQPLAHARGTALIFSLMMRQYCASHARRLFI